jgi:hypothetical protein
MMLPLRYPPPFLILIPTIPLHQILLIIQRQLHKPRHPLHIRIPIPIARSCVHQDLNVLPVTVLKHVSQGATVHRSTSASTPGSGTSTWNDSSFAPLRRHPDLSVDGWKFMG